MVNLIPMADMRSNILGSNAMNNQYLNLAIGAPRRLAILRANAIAWNSNPRHISQVDSWRDVRFGKLSYAADQWFPWRTSEASQGWYCDPDCNGTAIGFVGSIPHGRFIAGVRFTNADGYAYLPEVFTDAKEALNQADEHARILAEHECEYQTRWREARDLEDKISEQQADLCMQFALRHHKRLGAAAREAIADLTDAIRDARNTLTRNYGDVL